VIACPLLRQLMMTAVLPVCVACLHLLLISSQYTVMARVLYVSTNSHERTSWDELSSTKVCHTAARILESAAVDVVAVADAGLHCCR
jgi:hypothetical protein